MDGLKTLDELIAELSSASIPASADPCRTCGNPCDVGHLEYPNRLFIDNLSNMLGSVKPYMRQVVISTGKADWAHEVTEETGSLAQLLANNPSTSSSLKCTTASYPPSKPSTRIGILNGSHTSHEDETHRVLVFPDYKVVSHVPATKSGAFDLQQRALDPALGRVGAPTPNSTDIDEEVGRSYVLPYACVILICSHKKRDNRCHIAASKLETAICRELEGRGWNVDHNLRDEDCMGTSLEDLTGTEAEREQAMSELLRDAANGTLNDQKMALLIKVSHIGGHKFAGNIIIYTPQGPNGTGIWYGRVSPHEVPAVVEHTILQGQILPELLRGGVNMERAKGKSLLDW